MNKTLYQFLISKVPKDCVRTNEPMAAHTTFRVGGPAEFFVEIGNLEELREIIDYLHKTEYDFFVLGNGSNLLVGDKGYQGVVLHLGNRFAEYSVTGNVVTAQAGAMLSTVAKAAAAKGLTGMEFAAGIPGTIGGAIVMNAGAYDGEMQQIVTKVTVMTEDGEVLELDNETMEFGYRTSIIKNRPFIVLSAQMALKPGNAEEIHAKIEELNARRRSKQPLELPSAGSTFKRPEGHFAGKLIMDAGLRGSRIGGAQISEKHCGFIVNLGNASAADIYELMEEVAEKVEEQFSVRLEPEVVRLGDF